MGSAGISSGAYGNLNRFSLRADIGRHSVAAGGWVPTDEQELTEAVLEDQQDAEKLKEIAATRERRKKQFDKIDRNSILTVGEKASLAGAALDAGVETYARRMAQRLKAAGVPQPTVEVRFTDLTVATDAVIGSSALPTLPNSVKEPFAKLMPSASKRKKIHVLKSVTGILRPGTATLVLGPPGAGKTHLLRTLSGRLKTDELNKVEGEITYNGHRLNEFVVERTSAYIDQVDLHLPTLTVRQTLDFAARCMGEGALPTLLKECREKEQEVKARGGRVEFDPELDHIMAAMASDKQRLYTELIIRLLRLTNAADTVVGDALLRGISGGERKRVTSGEMMVGPVTCFFMDEISTGLDSSATFAISQACVHFAHILQRTMVIALLQPDPQTYDLFDDILLLSEGHIIYHGPRPEVMKWFNSLGFSCPEKKGIADFLQEVTSPKDQLVLRTDQSAAGVYMPVSEFDKAWRGSEAFRATLAALQQPYDKSRSHPLALAKTRYAISGYDALKANIWRHRILQKGDITIIGYRVIQGVAMGFIVGTCFFQRGSQSVNDGVQVLGVLYYSCMYMILDSVPEVAITLERKDVFYKQRNIFMFPAWSYAVPLTLMDLPILLLEVLPYTILVYWIAGFAATAGQFFLFVLIHYLTIVYADSMYRALGAASPDLVVGNSLSSFILLITLLTSGFTIIKSDIPGWWIWAYWINPYAWGLRALSINEFHSTKWDTDVNNLDGTNGRLGSVMLQLYDVQQGFGWVWAGVGFLLGIFALMAVLPVLSLTYLHPPKHRMTISEEDPEEAAKAEAPKVAVEMKDGEAAAASTGTAIGNGASHANGAEKKGDDEAALPFEPMALVFRDLQYFVPKPGDTSKELQLLKGIWGSFKPGVLTALMGASGAGKTTLMDVVAGRKTGGRIGGDILVNGHPKVQATFARVMGYVEQSDIHSPQTTVGEALAFSALLRLPGDVSRKRKLAFLEQMMRLVELENLRNALVGIPGETGLSVEQRKRLTIAVELVANPSVIFMDEPTSGLDARAAAIVMRVVGNISRANRTVVCTIHQPSTEIFEAFDQLLLLKRGGWTVFFGLLGDESSQLLHYFDKFDGMPPFEKGSNPSVYALEITGGFVPIKGNLDFAEIYTKSQEFAATKAEIDQLATPPPGSQPLSFKTAYAAGFLAQYRECLLKYFITYWRSPTYNMNSRFGMSIIIALVLGTLYLRKGNETSSFTQINNVIGAIYLFAMFLGYQNCLSVQPVISFERAVYYRERAARTYAVLPFSLAEATVEIPYLAVQTILFSVIVYWLMGFPSSASNFFFFLLVVFLNNACFTFVGELLVHVTPNVQLASVLSAGIMGIWKLFAGYIITQPDLPRPWLFALYGNPLTYVLYALSVKFWGDVDTELFYGDTPYTVKTYLEDVYFYHKNSKPGMWGCVGVLFGWIVVFRVGSFLALRFLSFQSR
ncbi:hypothetical protein WJX72_011087 [[Myrmecia] bisecta]|uniref:ABC transporter domain-containing protein n=1 Tax=[Myrmecia] bisecta TaxID=41462 RepID=A0AAW1Q1P6_9CHLO